MERLEDIVEWAECFLACVPLNVGTGLANSQPLGSVAELPFLPKVVSSLYGATAAVLSTGKVTRLTEDDSLRARSELIL